VDVEGIVVGWINGQVVGIVFECFGEHEIRRLISNIEAMTIPAASPARSHINHIWNSNPVLRVIGI